MAKVRPLGYVHARIRPRLVDELRIALDGAPSVECILGPATRRLGGWLVAPVSGLADLAAVVFEATEELVPVTHPQPFQAGIVLARGQVPREVAGQPVSASWAADSLSLVADRSSPRAIRYDDLAVIPLGASDTRSDMTEQVDLLPRHHDPAVRALATRVYELALNALAGGTVTVTVDEANIGVGTAPGYKLLVFVITPTKRYVRLGFARGAKLPDPAGVLEGAGKLHRHVKIRDGETLEAPALRDLMSAAVARARVCEPTHPETG